MESAQRTMLDCDSPIKTRNGWGRTKCKCKSIAAHQTAEIAKSVDLIRIRYSLHKSELPNGDLTTLGSYLQSLLSGRPDPAHRFPRVQRGWDSDGFPIFQRMGRRHRWEMAASMASIKRGLLIEHCPLHLPPTSFPRWRSNACRNTAPTTDSAYLRFCRTECKRIFKFGWDSTYESFCHTFVPRDSTRIEGRGSQWWSSNSSRDDYLKRTLNGRQEPVDFTLKYAEVPSVGKVRPMGIPTVNYDLLGPLHKSMYQYISRLGWCLRGPPTSSRIRALCSYQYQTSVDLVAATDNLRIDVAEVILSAALAKSKHVPGAIKVLALDSLRPTISHQGKVYQVNHGQMMGTYLSFPLLCLQSYLAARWATRNQSANILVNGDDCLISSTSYVRDYPDWAILNKEKTCYSQTVAEINSTQFIRVGGEWEKVRGLRRGAFNRHLSGFQHCAEACRTLGAKWQVAFCKKIEKTKNWKEKLCVNSLGFDLRLPEVRMAAKRHWQKGGYRYKPSKVKEDRWDMFRTEPTWGDVVCFNRDLFDKGRTPVTKKLTVIPWSDGIYSSRKKHGSFVSCQFARDAAKMEKERRKGKKKERLFCFSRDYDPAAEIGL